QNKQGKKKELYNVQGELLFSTKEDVIDVKHLARGMYYLRVEHEVKKVVVE
ncbi:MAG: T9SS type A sorting domain-containing protein, partial [Chitinophagaceae bacterium]|nr:T9SS type A sorting domain-containing protein [Chitinophagaceae bacterium]